MRQPQPHPPSLEPHTRAGQSRSPAAPGPMPAQGGVLSCPRLPGLPMRTPARVAQQLMGSVFCPHLLASAPIWPVSLDPSFSRRLPCGPQSLRVWPPRCSKTCSNWPKGGTGAPTRGLMSQREAESASWIETFS